MRNLAFRHFVPQCPRRFYCRVEDFEEWNDKELALVDYVEDLYESETLRVE